MLCSDSGGRVQLSFPGLALITRVALGESDLTFLLSQASGH